MNIFYSICEATATIVETIIFLDFLTKLLGRKMNSVWQSISLYAALVCINVFVMSMNILIPQYAALQDIGALILYLLYSFSATKGTRIMKTIAPVLTLTSILTINLITAFFLSFLFEIRVSNLVIDRSIQRLIALIITKVLFFLATRIVLYLFKPQTTDLSIKEYFAVALSFVCSVIIILYFAEIQYHSEENKLHPSTIIVLFSVVLINITSSIFFALLSKSNKKRTEHMMIEIQYQEQQKMYQSICSAYRNLEILQHDMKNELLSLQSLIHNGDIVHAEQFVERYTKTKLEHFLIYVQTGYELIDAIINIKLNYAREIGIDVSCQITADFTLFTAEDIISVFSNAIDNAIEASETMKNQYISVIMENKRDYLRIVIGNSINRSILESNAELHTTKKEKQYHGFGTQSIRNIVNNYDGMIEFYEKNRMFYADILLKHTKREAKPTK